MCGRQDHYLEGVILPYMETGLPGELNPGVFWLAAELLTLEILHVAVLSSNLHVLFRLDYSELYIV